MPESPYRIQSLARGLAIVSEVGESDGELTAAALSRRVGVSLQTTYHLLHTLRQVGYVQQDSAQRYRLGRAIPPLSEGYDRQFAPPEEAIRRLRRLRDATGETCSLSTWSGDDVVLIAQEAGAHAVRVADIQVGQRGALHARAAGKMLLARSDQMKRDRVLETLSFMRFTDRTITRRAKLELELDQAARRGWAIDDEEFTPRVTCVAAYLEHKGTDYAFAVLSPTERFQENSGLYLATLLETTQA